MKSSQTVRTAKTDVVRNIRETPPQSQRNKKNVVYPIPVDPSPQQPPDTTPEPQPPQQNPYTPDTPYQPVIPQVTPSSPSATFQNPVGSNTPQSQQIGSLFFQNVVTPSGFSYSNGELRARGGIGLTYTATYPDKITYYGTVTYRGVPVDSGVISTNYGDTALLGSGGLFSIYTKRANDIVFYLDNKPLDILKMINETNRIYVNLSLKSISSRKQQYKKSIKTKSMVAKKRKINKHKKRIN